MVGEITEQHIRPTGSSNKLIAAAPPPRVTKRYATCKQPALVLATVQDTQPKMLCDMKQRRRRDYATTKHATVGREAATVGHTRTHRTRGKNIRITAEAY